MIVLGLTLLASTIRSRNLPQRIARPGTGKARRERALQPFFREWSGMMGWTFPLASQKQTGSCGPDTSVTCREGKGPWKRLA